MPDYGYSSSNNVTNHFDGWTTTLQAIVHDVITQDGDRSLNVTSNISGRPVVGGGGDLTYSMHGVASQGALLFFYAATTLSAVIGNSIVILVFSIGKRSRTDLTGKIN